MPARATGRKRAALLVAALALAGAARAGADELRPPDDYDRLGDLERAAVDAVLGELHREVERAPAGKTIRAILVAVRPVFAEDEGFLTFFNAFHYTTREEIIRRELLFQPGDPWDQAFMDESLRNLRDPLFHNVLVILPLATDEPGRVDVLVVARDVWSLRLNTKYEIQNLYLSSLVVQITENNLFGLRKRVTAAFTMDQGTIAIGPTYYDPNIAGSHMTLQTLGQLILSRDALSVEGTSSDTILAYPFWSLREPWAAQLHVSHYHGFYRSFVGTALRTYDAPDTPEVEMLPWIYKRRELATEIEVVRSFGTDVIQRVGAGHALSRIRPALTDDFPTDETLRAAFTRDVLPRNELSSALYARWQLFTPVYAAYRDIDTFDLREDYQLGPTLEARVDAARTELGSDRDFIGLSASAGAAFAWGRGLYKASATMSSRLQDGRLIDQKWNLSLWAASPVVASGFRVLAAVKLDALVNETNNRFFALGGDNGLRGYEINAFSGLARALAHVELRTLPLRLGFFRIGATGFWDAGDAGPSLGDLGLKHDLGAGVRILVPQLDQIVIRSDWAFALNGSAAGWPGRFSLGVAQVF